MHNAPAGLTGAGLQHVTISANEARSGVEAVHQLHDRDRNVPIRCTKCTNRAPGPGPLVDMVSTCKWRLPARVAGSP